MNEPKKGAFKAISIGFKYNLSLFKLFSIANARYNCLIVHFN
ncbi:hypothetical protein QWZ13_09055 [Reinekea marina]|nr:hypothetical protein [Reinekea marina]MDN3649055.1 hypothetical protein [Reinekea marina]